MQNDNDNKPVTVKVPYANEGEDPNKKLGKEFGYLLGCIAVFVILFALGFAILNWGLNAAGIAKFSR